MVENKRRFLRSVAVAALVAALAAAAGADDVDDAMSVARKEIDALKQDEYEKIFGDRMAKLGQYAFRDQAYGFAQSVAKDTGWDAPNKLFVFKPSTAGGPVYWATWSSGKKGETQPGVSIVVTRYVHADGKSKFGETEAANSDAFAMVQATARAWAAGLEKPPAADEGAAPAADAASKEAEADRQACVEAVKKANGVATAFAASQGRLTATKKRERREWYGWAGTDATWVACVKYDETVLSKTNAALTKGKQFITNVHVYKGVSAK